MLIIAHQFHLVGAKKKNVTQEEETAFPALIQLPAQLSEER